MASDDGNFGPSGTSAAPPNQVDVDNLLDRAQEPANKPLYNSSPPRSLRGFDAVIPETNPDAAVHIPDSSQEEWPAPNDPDLEERYLALPQDEDVREQANDAQTAAAGAPDDSPQRITVEYAQDRGDLDQASDHSERRPGLPSVFNEGEGEPEASARPHPSPSSLDHSGQSYDHDDDHDNQHGNENDHHSPAPVTAAGNAPNPQLAQLPPRSIPESANIAEFHPPDHSAHEDECSGFNETFNWADVQARFAARMAAKRTEEQELLARFAKLTQFYNVWVASGAKCEEERASKRLRTRIAYVQHEEEQLRAKRQHHAKVIEAFTNALDLLNS